MCRRNWEQRAYQALPVAVVDTKSNLCHGVETLPLDNTHMHWVGYENNPRRRFRYHFCQCLIAMFACILDPVCRLLYYTYDSLISKIGSLISLIIIIVICILVVSYYMHDFALIPVNDFVQSVPRYFNTEASGSNEAFVDSQDNYFIDYNEWND